VKIEDSQGIEICDVITDLFPSYDTLKVKNRLLDGSYHIQTVGSKILTVSFNCACQHEGMMRLNQIEADSEPITVYYDDDTYTGLIDQISEWDEAVLGEKADRYYTARLRVVVT
jgi:hypothetical protein